MNAFVGLYVLWALLHPPSSLVFLVHMHIFFFFFKPLRRRLFFPLLFPPRGFFKAGGQEEKDIGCACEDFWGQRGGQMADENK